MSNSNDNLFVSHPSGGHLMEGTQISLQDNNNSLEPIKWVPNERSRVCLICSKKFGVFRRKHHCRSCGMLVCNSCSPDVDYVQGYKDRKVRVCKFCITHKVKRARGIDDMKVFNSLKSFRAHAR
jgi:hypothetical protein